MPAFPRFSSAVSEIKGSVFSALARRLATYEGEIYPLHIGDTWMEPAVGCRMQDLKISDHPGMHRYSPPQGLPDLLEAIAVRSARRQDVPTHPGNLLVAAGATGALGAAAGALLEPGDEVLVLAPHWPLIVGIIRSFHGRPIVVPLIGEADSAESAVEIVRSHRTEKTVAFYLSSPNNPTGEVLPPAWIRALVEWCAVEGLWVLADEIYEDYVYSGDHIYARSIAPERTFSVHSFSKAFGMAGNRCGYVAGPESAIRHLRRVSTHTFYSTPTASQLAALNALDGRGDRWVAKARQQYKRLGDAAAARLGVPSPQGGQFLFLDIADRLDARGLAGFLEDCGDRGLFVAPGSSFGPYPSHIRICFTSAPPATVERGVEVLAELLGR